MTRTVEIDGKTYDVGSEYMTDDEWKAIVAEYAGTEHELPPEIRMFITTDMEKVPEETNFELIDAYKNSGRLGEMTDDDYETFFPKLYVDQKRSNVRALRVTTFKFSDRLRKWVNEQLAEGNISEPPVFWACRFDWVDKLDEMGNKIPEQAVDVRLLTFLLFANQADAAVYNMTYTAWCETQEADE